MSTSLDEYIAKRFKEEGVRFYHAENLKSFRSHVARGALQCRARLMEMGDEAFNRFNSDETDAELNVLDRVFGNVYDYGGIFTRGPNTTPNIYGPITLVFRPDVYSKMHDIVITKKSIVSIGHGWRANSVSTEAGLNELLGGDGYGPVSAKYYYAELSCGNAELPLNELEKIVVDAITVRGEPLKELVERELKDAELDVPVEVRSYRRNENLVALQAVADVCELVHDEGGSPDDPRIAKRIEKVFPSMSQNMRDRVLGWAQYFFTGSLETEPDE